DRMVLHGPVDRQVRATSTQLLLDRGPAVGRELAEVGADEEAAVQRAGIRRDSGAAERVLRVLTARVPDRALEDDLGRGLRAAHDAALVPVGGDGDGKPRA